MKKIVFALLVMLSGCASMSNFQDIETARLPFDRNGEIVQVRTDSSFFRRTTTYIYSDGSVVSFVLIRSKIREGWKLASRSLQ